MTEFDVTAPRSLSGIHNFRIECLLIAIRGELAPPVDDAYAHELATKVKERIARGRCGRCGETALESYPAGSRITSCRCIPICSDCGRHEAIQSRISHLSPVVDWALGKKLLPEIVEAAPEPCEHSTSGSSDPWATPLPRQPFVVTPFGPQQLPEYVIDGGSALCSAFKGMKGVLMFTDTSIEFARDRSFGRGVDGIWSYGDLENYSLKRGLLMHVLALRPQSGRRLRFRIGEKLAVNARHILDAKGVQRR